MGLSTGGRIRTDGCIWSDGKGPSVSDDETSRGEIGLARREYKAGTIVRENRTNDNVSATRGVLWSAANKGSSIVCFKTMVHGLIINICMSMYNYGG